MDKVKLFQKLPQFVKNLLAAYRGYQLISKRNLNRSIYVKEIALRDSWTKEQINEYKHEKLREMLDFAYKNVPYYREIWKNIKAKNPLADHLDINNWPILEKDEVRNNPDLFIADGLNKKSLIHIPTSGTSGKPMNFWFDDYTMSYYHSMREYRLKTWHGIGENENWANIGGQLICDVKQKKPPFWIWNFTMRQLYLSSYHITPENTKFYLEALSKYKIQYIICYVSSIYNLANEGLLQNLVMPKLKLIITNAEPLYKHQRETIEKAFGCPVVETYGPCEFSLSASEDKNGMMYNWPEVGYLEFLKDDGSISSEGKGEILTTGLLNKAMPLIRYRLGDSGVYCSGESGNLPYDYFTEITGRTDDMVLTAEGKLVGRLDPVFKSNLQIKEAQIVQENFTTFTIKLVADKGFTSHDTESIESRLKDRVGQDITVNFEMLDKIPRGPNGKFKAVVSKVNLKKTQ
jgi:phenylacetate-CoA ligase